MKKAYIINKNCPVFPGINSEDNVNNLIKHNLNKEFFKYDNYFDNDNIDDCILIHIKDNFVYPKKSLSSITEGDIHLLFYSLKYVNEKIIRKYFSLTEEITNENLLKIASYCRQYFHCYQCFKDLMLNMYKNNLLTKIKYIYKYISKKNMGDCELSLINYIINNNYDILKFNSKSFKSLRDLYNYGFTDKDIKININAIINQIKLNIDDLIYIYTNKLFITEPNEINVVNQILIYRAVNSDFKTDKNIVFQNINSYKDLLKSSFEKTNVIYNIFKLLDYKLKYIMYLFNNNILKFENVIIKNIGIDNVLIAYLINNRVKVTVSLYQLIKLINDNSIEKLLLLMSSKRIKNNVKSMFIFIIKNKINHNKCQTYKVSDNIGKYTIRYISHTDSSYSNMYYNDNKGYKTYEYLYDYIRIDKKKYKLLKTDTYYYLKSIFI